MDALNEFLTAADRRAKERTQPTPVLAELSANKGKKRDPMWEFLERHGLDINDPMLNYKIKLLAKKSGQKDMYPRLYDTKDTLFDPQRWIDHPDLMGMAPRNR